MIPKPRPMSRVAATAVADDSARIDIAAAWGGAVR
jgi:hypothetical protein